MELKNSNYSRVESQAKDSELWNSDDFDSSDSSKMEFYKQIYFLECNSTAELKSLKKISSAMGTGGVVLSTCKFDPIFQTYNFV